MNTPTGHAYVWYEVACASCGETFEIASCDRPVVGIGERIVGSASGGGCTACGCLDWRVVGEYGEVHPGQKLGIIYPDGAEAGK